MVFIIESARVTRNPTLSLRMMNTPLDNLDTPEELQVERKRLQKRIEAIKADFHRGLNKDSSERSVELENSEVLNELMRVSEARLSEIEESRRKY